MCRKTMFARCCSYLTAIMLCAVFLTSLSMPLQAAEALTITPHTYKTDQLDIAYPVLYRANSPIINEQLNSFFGDLAYTLINQLHEAAADGEKYHDPQLAYYHANMQYTVEYQSDYLLSISVITYLYTGGAHGMTNKQGYTFDLQTGELLPLQNFLPLTPATQQRLQTTILQQATARDLVLFEPFAGIPEHPAFYLNKDKQLVLVFQPYEIGPYSSGILEFPLH